MGRTSGLEMSVRQEVHRILAGAENRRGHNRRLLLPVMNWVNEEMRKRRRPMRLASKTWTRLKLGSCSLREHKGIRERGQRVAHAHIATTVRSYLLLLWSGIR